MSEELSIQEKGDLGEEAFLDWCGTQNISVLPIDQSKEKHFYIDDIQTDAKRPDFVVFGNGLVTVLVDVKNRKNDDKNQTDLPLDEKDYRSGLKYEQKTKIQMWFVYPEQQLTKTNCSTETWLWINAYEAISNGKINCNGSKCAKENDRTYFFSIPKSAFHRVTSKDDVIKILEVNAM
jgi:hypothetical protein